MALWDDVDYEIAAFDRRNTLADGVDGGMPIQPPYGVVPSLASLHANPAHSALRRVRHFVDAHNEVMDRPWAEDFFAKMDTAQQVAAYAHASAACLRSVR